jgi:hypothetical protein
VQQNLTILFSTCSQLLNQIIPKQQHATQLTQHEVGLQAAQLLEATKINKKHKNRMVAVEHIRSGSELVLQTTNR